MRPTVISIVMLTSLAAPDAACRADDGLRTRWADDVSVQAVHAEYPRPQMVRRDWTNLNGAWSYAITPHAAARPERYDGDILVPFCVESALSGVQRAVGPEQALWYRRTFSVPSPEPGRLLLHFGAVDWEATVWINDQRVGVHQGGYDAFTFDVTDALRDGENELVVRVWDPTDAGPQPRGKQVREPGGIWYTAVTGIWQTVWLEPVPAAYLQRLHMTPRFEQNAVQVGVDAVGAPEGATIDVSMEIDGEPVRASGPLDRAVELRPSARIPAWSPETPILHDIAITLRDARGRSLDFVSSYVGFRSIAVRPDTDGVHRLFLNGEALFQYGPLDQGWWPDGLYTAPTDEALRYDIEMTKRLGFNMVRKHVKVEPARWYAWCDILGLLVWQDMPSGDRHIHGDMPDIERTAVSAAAYERELRAMIDGLSNHPCVVVWVPFNEGWGQWDTARIAELVRELDPTRVVDAVSGWTDRGVGDLVDVHRYPGPGMAEPELVRASVLGEFGGLGLPLPGHLWRDQRNWGYRTYDDRDSLTQAYERLLEETHRLVGRGLAAAVYTQTTDVEIEVNGLMTYDRAVVKLDADRAARAARRLYGPPPVLTTIVPLSSEERLPWRYTTSAPPGSWFRPTFDDGTWSIGPGGFGTAGTPGADVGTRWDTEDLWIRRTFTLDAVPGDVELFMHHDEDAQVYINGILVARTRGYRISVGFVPMDVAAPNCLVVGTNTIAVHVRNTTGGQYVDVGLVAIQHWE